jgi:hypothetical protein
MHSLLDCRALNQLRPIIAYIADRRAYFAEIDSVIRCRAHQNCRV